MTGEPETELDVTKYGTHLSVNGRDPCGRAPAPAVERDGAVEHGVYRADRGRAGRHGRDVRVAERAGVAARGGAVPDRGQMVLPQRGVRRAADAVRDGGGGGRGGRAGGA